MILADVVNTPEAWSERARCEEPWEACGWSYEGQFDRHEAAVEALDPKPGESLLDWGCGTGDLVESLSETVDYVGFDTADGMIDRARRDHPGRRFATREPHGHYDLIACIGPFNLPDHWSKLRTWHTLRHLWDTKAPRALVASLYAGDDDRCLIYTEPEVRGAAYALTWNPEILRVRNDLMLVVRR